MQKFDNMVLVGSYTLELLLTRLVGRPLGVIADLACESSLFVIACNKLLQKLSCIFALSRF